MGTRTDRLGLFKVDTSLAASDPVDVDLNLNANYDILDDNAPLRTRANGVFPGSNESFEGAPLYQPNGKVYSYQDDNEWHVLKQMPSYAHTVGNTGAIIGNAADVYLNWGHSENRNGVEFESDGEIRFKTTGLFYLNAGFNLDGTAGNYERYFMIMVSDASNSRKMRIAQNRTQGNVCRVSVGGFVKISSDRIGWKAAAAIFQNSGATIVYNDTISHFTCTRLGGYFGD